jgi:drug/metabolite transporter (DMT)-like permease
VKKFIVLSLLVLFQVLGNVELSHGMRQIGEVNTLNPLLLLKLGSRVLTNPWIILGVAFLIASLLLYLAAISRLDLSYVLPITESSYVLTTLFAWLMLSERISVARWVGTLTISVGVLIVGLSESSKATRKAVKSADQMPRRDLR